MGAAYEFSRAGKSHDRKASVLKMASIHTSTQSRIVRMGPGSLSQKKRESTCIHVLLLCFFEP